MSRSTPNRPAENPPSGSPLSLEDLKVRVLVLCGGLCLIALLGLTRWLVPDPRGLGTHEQLGLPPCGFYLWSGLPCPSCGMTTSWAWLVRGEMVQAGRQHFGGALLGGYSLLLGVWLVVSAVQGRWFGGWPSSLTWAVKFSVLTLAILITWIVKLWA